MSKSTVKYQQKNQTQIKPYSSEVAEHAVLYEVNIRQYSKAGTFKAFTKDIPKLKKLGVKIIWVMPIQPISLQRRKTSSGQFIEELKDPKEKEKQLGSYYAISNYTAVHPDYGALNDFKKLVKTAHKNGMYVILDWVANHTGWDHKWIEEHPEYYHKNAHGEVTEPLKPWNGEPEGWGDVAHLNYDHEDLFDVMKEEMMYWLKETDIDGFRCDVAERVKLEFWEYIHPKLNNHKPVFMLMEADNPDYLDGIFNMGYNWKTFHVFNEIAQGFMNADNFEGELQVILNMFENRGIPMNFTSNHDENSWKGSEYERLGNAVETFAALTYVMPGMPLIYNGQENDSKHALKFFEKDSIRRKKGKMYSVYKKLGELKNEHPALNSRVEKAPYQRLDTENNHKFLVFKREHKGKKVFYLANLSNSYTRLKSPIEGAFKDYMNEKPLTLERGQEISFKPWQYYILTQG